MGRLALLLETKLLSFHSTFFVDVNLVQLVPALINEDKHLLFVLWVQLQPVEVHYFFHILVVKCVVLIECMLSLVDVLLFQEVQ